MDDYSSFGKTIVRELSCRLCLCNDVVRLKPLSGEVKRKIKKLFDVVIRGDDNLPKAICHDCLQQVSNMHLYAVKVEKTQKFLNFYKSKNQEDIQDKGSVKTSSSVQKLNTANSTAPQTPTTVEKKVSKNKSEMQHGDTKSANQQSPGKKKTAADMKHMEAMPLEEFVKVEKVDKALLETSNSITKSSEKVILKKETNDNLTEDTLDPIVLIDGRPARQGTALDRQITLFYKMECGICHEKGFNFRSLMKHYKERHGVPGYVSCCNKKFHYFYPKKIIEHMAFHLQPNVFMCRSCNQNFQTSQDLHEHQINGGRSDGKIMCPRCSERFPTYRELGWHLVKHRGERSQCDYCAKLLKHTHRKKTINQMENVILCSQCVRTLRSIEKQEKEIREKTKAKYKDLLTIQKHQKFKQALGISGDDDSSTDE